MFQKEKIDYTNQRKSITFGKIGISISEHKIASYLKLKRIISNFL